MFWPVLMLIFVFWIQEFLKFSPAPAWAPLAAFVILVGALGAAYRRRRSGAS
jgi:hypothetical protein